MRHVSWTREGRRLELSTGQGVYRAFLGQENLELADGSFAPYLWSEDARVLRFGDVEARFVRDAVEFWRGGELQATTRTRLQRRTARGWRDEPARIRIERLADEDELRGWALARIAVVLESEHATARHIIVAGGRSRARADTELRAHLPGEYRVVLDHDLGGAPTRAVRSGGACGAIARNGWRIAWRREESRDREVEITAIGLSIALAQVRRAKGQKRPAHVLVSPDTYGPVANAGAGDDSQSDASAFNIDGVTSGAAYIDFHFVDDSDAPQDCVALRWASVDLLGLPASIDAGSGIIGDRTDGPGDGGSGHIVRFRCQQSNTPATGADTADTTTGRPFLRTYLAANSEHTYNQGTGTVSPDLTTALQGLVTAGYSYSGDSSEAVMITAGANSLWGITAVSWAHIGADVEHPTCDPIELQIVFTPGVDTAPRTLFLTNTATSGSAPTTSFLLNETNASSGVTIEAGTWTDALPGTADSGQWNPGLSPATADEIDSTANAGPSIRGSTTGTATNSPTSPAGTQVGDLVIVIHWTRNGAGIPTHTLQSGFTEIRSHSHNDGSTDGRLSMAYQIATSSGANAYNAYTSSAGTDYAGIVVLTAGTFDFIQIGEVSNSATITGTGASNPPAVTTPVAQCLVMVVAGYHVPTSTFNLTAPTNYTETWELAGSLDADLGVATRVLAAAGAEDPGVWTDNGTPNGTCAMTVSFRPNPRQEGTTRRGWLWDEDLTDKVMLGGAWTFNLRLSAISGSGETGRICARASIVEPSGSAWVTKKQLFAPRVTGSASLTIGQDGWRDQEEARITVTSTPTDFEVTVAGGASHTFAADERLFVELGFCDAGSTSSREWAVHFNDANTWIETSPIEVDSGISGTASPTLAALTSSAAGVLPIVGASSATLGALTSSAAGTVAIAGAGAPTLAALALSAAGAGAAEIVGDLAATLGSLASSGTGVLPIAGASAPTLAALASSAAGALPIAGASAPTLGSLTSTAAAVLPIVGTASTTLGALTSSAAGALRIAGASTATLDAATLSASGAANANTGTAAATLSDVVSAATGVLAVAGTATPALGAVTSSGAGVLPLAATCAATLGTLAATVTGTLPIAGACTPTLGAATTSATGALPIVGAGGSTLGALILAASGVSTVITTGDLAVTLGALTMGAVGALPISAAAAPTLAALMSAAAGAVANRGASAETLADLASSASSRLAVAASLAQQLGDADLSASGTLAVLGALGRTLAELGVSATGTESIPDPIPVGELAALLSPPLAYALVVNPIGTVLVLAAPGAQAFVAGDEAVVLVESNRATVEVS